MFLFYFCRVNSKNNTMKKDIGKWFMDIAKYVATAVLISSFLGGLQQKWLMYVIGTLVVILFLSLGLFYANDKTKTIKK